MQELYITLIGDSIAKGIITKGSRLAKLQDSACSLIEKFLNCKIKNLSVFGQTLKRVAEKKIIETYINNLDLTKRNIVVFSIGGNDSDYNWQEVAENPTLNHYPKTKSDEFITLLKQMINKLKKKDVEVWITGLPPVNSERYFKNVISQVADGKEILKFYGGDVSNIQRHQELYNFLLYRTAVNTDCKFLDVRSHFLKKRDFLNSYCKDGVHPNEQGHKEIASEIIKQLIDYGVKPQPKK
ncbi:MAG: SGNH/GDSL hydrolase family protein [Clostridia bacterium]|nr:SGNH/GDSL hydrolase family protein [Clostridia bacterium]